MADPLSIAAGIVAFVDCANKIKGKITDAKNAEETTAQLSALIGDLRDDLQKLDRYFRSDEIDPYLEPYRRIYEKNPRFKDDPSPGPYLRGPLLRQIEPLLTTLEIKLRPWEERQSTDTESRLAFDQHGQPDKQPKAIFRKHMGLLRSFTLRKRSRQIQWAYEKKEIEKKVDVLRALKQEMAVIKNDVVYKEAVRAGQDRDNKQADQIANWLNPANFEDIQQYHASAFLGPNIPSDWLTRDPIFERWQTGKSWHLVLYGLAGSGKSVLASQIISHLRKCTKPASAAVIFAYLRHEEQKTQTIEHVLALLLKQLVLQRRANEVLPAIVDEYNRARKLGQSCPEPQKVYELLQAEIRCWESVYIVVDGLDEASDETQLELLRRIQKVSITSNENDQGARIRFLYTSRRLAKQEREIPEFCQGVADGEPCPARDPPGFYAAFNTGRMGRFLCELCTLSDQSILSPELRFSSIDVDIHTPDESIKRYLESLLAREMAGTNHKHDLSLKEIEDLSEWDTDRELEAGAHYTPFHRTLRRHKYLARRIVDSIAHSCENLYILAHMQWKYVSSFSSKFEVEKALMTVPTKVNQYYSHTMNRLLNPTQEIDHRKRERARRVVLWVCQSYGRLTLGGLQDAMAITLRDEQSQAHALIELDSGYNNDQVELMTITRGLVTMLPDRTLHLHHKTAYEYFEDLDIQQTWFPDRDVYMARICLLALSASTLQYPCEDSKIPGQARNETTLVKERVRAHPFAAYASCTWGFLAETCQTQPDIASSLRTFFALPGNLASAVQLGAYHEEIQQIGVLHIRKGLSALHVAAWYGLESVFGNLTCGTEGHLSVDAPDTAEERWTPLIYACRAGHARAVTKLLELGADSAYKDPKGRNAILSAAGSVDLEKQNPAVTALCNDPNVDVNTGFPSGLNALIYASMKGYWPVVQTLAQHKDIKINAQGSGGYTALAMAAQYGFTEVADVLLAHKDIDVDLCNEKGQAALHLAAMNGHVEIVRNLLNHKANVSVCDALGGTPLRRAIDTGQTATVEEFSRRNMLLENKDSFGKGLLCSACENGQADLVQLLIGHQFDTTAQSDDGRTPLHYAASCGKIQVVQVLLQYEADATLRDNQGRTAAELARDEQGDRALVELLDSAQRGNQPTEFNERDLPATTLARNGSNHFIKERISRTNTDIFLPNSGGDTPLAVAIRYRNFDAARMILRACTDEGVGVESVNKSRRTPLHEAVDTNDVGIVKELLAHSPTQSFEVRDKSEVTPLQIAILWKNADIVVELLNAGAEVDRASLPPPHTLSLAIETGKIEVVRKLLSGGMRVQTEHLLLAEEKGYDDIHRLLRRNWTKVRTVRMSESGRVGTLDSTIEETEKVFELTSPSSKPSPDFSKLDIRKPVWKQREPMVA